MTTITHAKHGVAPVAAPTSKTIETVDLPENMAELFDELSEVTLARQTAEAREKELKAAIMASVPAEQHKNVTFALRVKNAIRGKISVRTRTGIDQKLLLAAFPEAHAATAKETEYRVFSA